jgi:hypothetical protein
MGASKGGYAYPRFPFAFPVTKVTATSTLNPGQCGIIVVAGTADVTLTLPSPTGATGLWYLIAVSTDYHLTVAAPTADTLITFNDVAADNIQFTTDANNVGGIMLLFSDGTNWIGDALTGGTRTVGT